MSARSSRSNMNKWNTSSNVTHNMAIDGEDFRAQHWMSGFIKTPQMEISRASMRNPDPQRSSSLNPSLRNQFYVVQESQNEDNDVDELLTRIDSLTKENKVIWFINFFI